MIECLEKDECFWAKDLDQERRFSRLFFNPKVQIDLSKSHPDVILLENTYTTNRYKMPMMKILAFTSNDLNLSVDICFMEKEDTESVG